MNDSTEKRVRGILKDYHDSFKGKQFNGAPPQTDILMRVFGITQKTKRKNMQYWSRELGMIWEKVVKSVFQNHLAYSPPPKEGRLEYCDFLFGSLAIDTKYRVALKDGTKIKKIQNYAQLLKGRGMQPVMLILREDNDPQTLASIRKAGWEIYTGEETFRYIKTLTQTNLKQYLESLEGQFLIA